jgi:hypothetical protein
MSTISCPACGSTDIQTNTEVELITEAFGGNKDTEITIQTCKSCGISGDFLNLNDKTIQNTIDNLKDKSVENILNTFLENNYSFAGIERALEIPQRTLSRWKNKTTKPSAPSIALLKFLRLFPWLIEVAEQRYDYSKAQKIHISDSLAQFVKQMTFNNEPSVLEATTTIEMFAQVKISTSSEPFQADNDDINFGFTLPEIEAQTIS